MLNRTLEQSKKMKQNWTGPGKIGICFSVFFECCSGSFFLAGRLGSDYVSAQFLDLPNFSQDLQIKSLNNLYNLFL